MKKNLAKLGVLIAILGIAAFAVTRGGDCSPQDTHHRGLRERRGASPPRRHGGSSTARPISPTPSTRSSSPKGALRHACFEAVRAKSQWTLEEPLKSAAVKFRVEKLIKLFKERTTSVHSKSIKPDDHALFDFEAERRIRLTLKSKGSCMARGGSDHRAS